MAGYVYGASRNARIDELHKQAEAKRAEAAELQEAIKEDLAASQALTKATTARRAAATKRYRAKRHAPDLATRVDATMQWVNICLPDPKYGGETGLYAAAREVEGYRSGGRNGALMAA